jgi:hypothetical protein
MRVRVFAGVGAGCREKPQGFPSHSLPLTPNTSQEAADYAPTNLLDVPSSTHNPPPPVVVGAGLVHRHSTLVKSGDPLDWHHRHPRRSDRDQMILHSHQRRRPGRSEDLVPVFFLLMVFLSCRLTFCCQFFVLLSFFYVK